MGSNPPIRRLTLVPAGDEETVRRYRLARLDEIALASPPYEPPENRRSADTREADSSAEPEPPG